MGGEANAEQALEALFDVGVEQAKYLIDRIEIDVAHREFSTQEYPIFGADRKASADEAIVPSEHMLVQISVVFLGRGHHERLVLERPLAKREPHRGEVLLLTPHAQEPPHARLRARLGNAFNGDDVVVARIELS